MTPQTVRVATWLLFAAVGLLGLAHIAFLPPFEGFDEPAHLSYIQQLADTDTLPRVGSAFLSTDVEAYSGPMPYGIRVGPGDQPARTYQAFAARDEDLPAAAAARGFRPGVTPNWEAQHPPLYYALLAPFYSMARDWSWPHLFLLLRGVSWAMAFGGFVAGTLASQRVLTQIGTPPLLHLVAPAWPLLVPAFFPEMARLGNDSLCLLLMGVAWSILVPLLAAPTLRRAAVLGLVLALGCWTKGFFIPVTAGICALLVYLAYRARVADVGRMAIVVVIVVLALGLPWYVQGYAITGGFGFLQADRPGAAIIHGVNFEDFLHGLGGIAVSFVWSGTWSFARLPAVFTVPVLILVAVCGIVWFQRLRNAPAAVWAPLFIVTPVVLGLAAHVLTQIVREGQGNGTPGWYLHIFQALLAMIVAVGWRRGCGWLAAYALVFQAVCWIIQLSLFSGCAFKTEGVKYVQLGECVITPHALAALGFPVMGGAAAAGALVAVAAAAVLATGWRGPVEPRAGG